MSYREFSLYLISTQSQLYTYGEISVFLFCLACVKLETHHIHSCQADVMFCL
jgi:hypothetical protein